MRLYRVLLMKLLTHIFSLVKIKKVRISIFIVLHQKVIVKKRSYSCENSVKQCNVFQQKNIQKNTKEQNYIVLQAKHHEITEAFGIYLFLNFLL